MNIEDEKLLLKRIADDPQQFSIIFDRFYKMIFGYIIRRTGDYDVARDVASETFLKAYLNISKFNYKGISVSSWLYRIATNEMNMFFRKNKYRPVSLDDLVENTPFDYADPLSTNEEKSRIENEMRQHKDFAQVQQHLKHLKTKYQEVIALKYFEQKSIREISEILDKNEGTVKSLLSRGIEMLRQKMI
ncbi:MAG: RNA polymerase sigma factor [Bacteroidia bacterium]